MKADQNINFDLLDMVKQWETAASQIMGIDVKLKPIYADLRDTYFSPEEYFEIVVKSISEVTSLSVDNILSHKRDRQLVEARFIAYHLLDTFAKKYSWHLTKVRIGRFFQRDHSTIIYGLQTYQDLVAYDKKLKILSDKVYDRMVSEMVERAYTINTKEA